MIRYIACPAAHVARRPQAGHQSPLQHLQLIEGLKGLERNKLACRARERGGVCITRGVNQAMNNISISVPDGGHLRQQITEEGCA